MLGMRILVSACVIPALIFLFWLDMKLGPSAWILLAFCVAVAVRASYELTHLLSVRAMQPSFPVTAFLSTAVVVGGWLHAGSLRPGEIFQLPVALGAIAACIVASFSFLMLWECIRYASPGTSMESLGANVITVLYAGGLLAVTAQFRWFPDPELAYYALVAMIITVKSGDIGAYSLGRMLGRRKMAPRLSPGKTWMGGVGALLGSAAGGMAWLYFGGRLFDQSPQPASALNALLFCLVLGVVGLVGDLCESLIKRDCGKKDSAALMPGFGGLLDLVDSPLFAGPCALAWWYLFPMI